MRIEHELSELQKLWSGFWTSRVVLTANNLGIFEQLRTVRTAAETAQLTGTDIRGAEILLNALTGLGLLRKTSGKYRNTAMANRFLTSESPFYQGDILRHADVLWNNWSRLDEVVRSGAPAREARDHGSFIRGMHNVAVLRAGKVIAALDLQGVRRTLDLGGGPGTYSIELARKGIAVTLFDLPDTLPIARQIAAEAGVEGIEFRAGDLFTDDIGDAYDLIFISQVLHSFSPEENRSILEKCGKALQPGGKIAILEFLIDNNLAYPRHSALFAVNMLVNTSGGRCYAPREIMRWLAETGFRKRSAKPLGDTILVFGSA